MDENTIKHKAQVKTIKQFTKKIALKPNWD